MELDGLLLELIKRGGSDLHLKVGRPPLFRISGDLLPSEFPILTPELMASVLPRFMDKRAHAKFMEEREADLPYAIHGRGRFRINVFFQRGQLGLVMRLIPLEVPSIEHMGLPAVLRDVVQKPQGLVLVTGPTGSGKSTTLSAMIDHVNKTRHVHVITIEDPVEFVYRDDKATINQRQLGTDTLTLNQALKRALRQDPDIILIGELRDRETMETAMHAAETGHLVFSTLHTNDAKQTIDRLLDSFPKEQQKQLCKMLSLNLIAVLSQRLVKRADGNGRVCAMEIMINSPHIAQLLEAADTLAIETAIAKSDSYYRMQTYNQSLFKLVNDELITKPDAMASTFNPDDLNLMFRGIMRGAGDTSMIPGLSGKKEEAKAKPAKKASAPPPPKKSAPPAPAAAPASGSKEDKSQERKAKVVRGFDFS